MDFHRIAEDALCAAAALGARELCRWCYSWLRLRREMAKLESEMECCPPAEVSDDEWFQRLESFEGEDWIS